LKKRSKKFLIFDPLRSTMRDSGNKSFLVLFFKKELLAYLSMAARFATSAFA